MTNDQRPMTNNSPLRLLCVFSGLLGNGTLSLRLEEMINAMPDVEAQFVYVGMQDFIDCKAPWWVRLSNSWETAYVSRKVLQKTDIRPFDMIFVNGLEHALSTREWIKKYPSIIGCDATVNLSQQQMRRIVKSPLKKIKSYITGAIVNPMYRNIFKYNDFFLPMSQWCADDLVCSYGVLKGQCLVSYVPIDFKNWPFKKYCNSKKQKILFIGNHFKRKGGDLLISIHEKYLKEKIEFVIISNDPVLEGLNKENITVLRNIPHEQISNYFIDADLFVFPTRKEYLGVVVTEALASGLPVIASDTGSINEFVITGKTGTLMPYDATQEEWAEAILDLLADRTRLFEYSKAARQVAKDMFSKATLQLQLERIFTVLRKKCETQQEMNVHAN